MDYYNYKGEFTQESMEGIKYDNGKPMVGTLVEIFPNALMEVGKCIEYGTHKYPDVHNWEKLDGAMRRYQDALMRHLIKHNLGIREDDESHILHLSHMAWNALAILELYMKGVK